MLAGNQDGMSNQAPSPLESRLRREITGDVLFDPFSRGRYATDASFYQIVPAGVVVPRSIDEALRALAIARDDGRIVTPRAAAAPRNAARPSTTASSSTSPSTSTA
jgi:FAD/FMN-containing dehydrogenase